MDSVAAHYHRPDLLARIDQVLVANGKDPAHLTPDDLAPLDQFHIGGKAATLMLAQMGEIRAEDCVLDVGGGLGGPARLLASVIGCHVTVLDLTEEYVAVGRELTRRCGLSSRVDFLHGDAVELPFDDGFFSVIWSQHSSMNVEDKMKLYAGIHRVLKSRGRYVMHEVFAGARQPVKYPTPWASREELSFLIQPESARELLTAAGLHERKWQDTTVLAADWLAKRLAAQTAPGPQLGLHLLMGDLFQEAFPNLLGNLRENRLAVIESVWGK